MRGKIRDKYSTNRRDSFHDDEGDMRRPARRAGHVAQWIDQSEDEEEEYEEYLAEESEEDALLLAEEELQPSIQKIQQVPVKASNLK
ncbi:hypothetical protein ccbrp13_26910 [Ktedonobacteria bacterium brp13]|nr:hypothetical protein ccbrp13_26910 [Ktedonobacteria bacterium brp13]